MYRLSHEVISLHTDAKWQRRATLHAVSNLRNLVALLVDFFLKKKKHQTHPYMMALLLLLGRHKDRSLNM